MFGSSMGTLFRFMSYGESHGCGLGGIVDGCPPGLALDVTMLQAALDQRKVHSVTRNAGTSRCEPDQVHLLSGVWQGQTTGTPIAFFIGNVDQQSKDYAELAHCFRPGHADYCYQQKYGLRDHRGGGRASARETAARVVAGAIAQSLLDTLGIEIMAATLEIGGISCAPLYAASCASPSPSDLYAAQERFLAHRIRAARDLPYYAIDAALVPQWDALVQHARNEADSVGGIVRLEVEHMPVGLGEPVFAKLDALLGAALFSVGAVKGLEFGCGFQAARMYGSEHNDAMLPAKTPPGVFASNHAGGVLGGISSGQNLSITAAIKPIPSIGKAQQSITASGDACTLHIQGRHDCCAIPRIVPVLKAMVALVLADAVLMHRRLKRAEEQ